MGDDGRERFAELFGDRADGVKPMADRDRVARTPPPRAARRAASDPDEPAAAFEHPQPEEPLLAFAPGLDRASFRRLRQGGWRPDRRVDLHGEDVDGARRAVTDSILEAAACGDRCVLVIHGRGLHSTDEPVLRSGLPRWLAEAPLGPRILAFAPATPADGGSGATYVLLRRSRT